jgi:hypothetical protein
MVYLLDCLCKFLDQLPRLVLVGQHPILLLAIVPASLITFMASIGPKPTFFFGTPKQDAQLAPR